MKTTANMDFHSSHTLKKKQPTTLTKEYYRPRHEDRNVQPCYWCETHI